MAVAVNSAVAKPPGEADTRSVAVLGPASVGVKVTVMPQLTMGSSGRSQDGSGLMVNSVKLIPSRLTETLPAAEAPSLVTWNENALFMPIGTMPKLCDVGVRVSLDGSRPVPARVAESTRLPA